MTHVATSNAVRAPPSDERIVIRPRSGVWRIDVDGRFYGDYMQREWAVEGAFERADATAANSGAAIVTTSGEADGDATLYDTRQTPPEPVRQPEASLLGKLLNWL